MSVSWKKLLSETRNYRYLLAGLKITPHAASCPVLGITLQLLCEDSGPYVSRVGEGQAQSPTF